MNEYISHSTRMRIAGFIPMADQGFAVPAFQHSDKIGNAWYSAIPLIEGDQQAPVGAFDIWEGSEPHPLDHGTLVGVGDTWHDVFLWRDDKIAGTPPHIYERLKPHHAALKDEAPLSFLELSLAAGASKTVEVAGLARDLLSQRLGEQNGADAFCDSVVRSGVLLQIRRCHQSAFPEEILYGLPVDFEVKTSDDQQYQVILGDTAIEAIPSQRKLDELKDAISRFGDTIGVEIVLLDGVVPPPLPSAPPLPPPPADEVLAVNAPRTGRARSGPRSRLFGLAREMAVDLGSGNTRLFVRGRGLAVSEPSMIALRQMRGFRKVFVVGAEAKQTIGREPGGITVVQPVKDGIINDSDAAVEMLKHFFEKVGAGRRFGRPVDVLICAPSGATTFERHNLRAVAKKAGASTVWLTDAPLAAAVGADLPVAEPVGSMVVHIGSGATDVAILTMRNLAYFTSIRVGGDKMDEAIVSYLRRHYNLAIGIRTAEVLRLGFGEVNSAIQDTGDLIHVRGSDILNGIPREMMVPRAIVVEAIAESAALIIEGVRMALENTAPELAADIIDSGIVLTGGGALLPGMDETIRKESGLPVTIARDPMNSVVIGLARMLDDTEWRRRLGIDHSG